MFKNKYFKLTVFTIILLITNKTFTETIKATQKVEGDWDSGHQASITVTNNAKADTKDWHVEFDLNPGQKITGSWNAEFEIKENHVIASNPKDWGNVIKPGGSYEIGMTLSTKDKNTPRSFKNLKAIANLNEEQPKSSITPTTKPSTKSEPVTIPTSKKPDTKQNQKSSSSTKTTNTKFAPFVDASSHPIQKLSEIAKHTGVKHFVLGFIVAKNSKECTPTWGTYYDLDKGPDSWGKGGQEYLYDELTKLREMGGDYMISLGGADNTPLAATCTSPDTLAKTYEQIINKFKLKQIDFDIEGNWVADKTSIENRNKALVILQKKSNNINVWFTLPVLTSGLTQDGINVIKDALKKGVKLTGVNIMAMDYGDESAPNPSGKMGKYAIDAATALKKQLQTIYKDAGKSLSDNEAWSMVGITPMIGLNDITTESFDLKDAEELQKFAKDKNIGLLSMWSINRDHSCGDKTSVQIDCSSTKSQTKAYQFSEIFNK